MLDVAIIGAGVAGLAAARRLRGSSLSVQIFEARDRTGGRAYSPELSGHPADVGATWVWDSERAIHALLKELGVGTFPHFDAGQDTLDDTPLRRGRFPRGAVPERRISGGVQRIADALTADAPLTMGTAVHSLDPEQSSVRIGASDGVHHAKVVLAALPPSLVAPMLAASDPDASDLLSRVPVWMGDVAKVVATFSDRFWERQGSSGRAVSQRGPMVEVHDMSGEGGTPARLFGFVPRAADGPDLEERVRAQLIRLFGPDAEPIGLHIHAWWSEAYTTEADPKTEPRLFGHSALRAPFLDGTLHLVGCETSGISPGHLNGAAERADKVCGALLRR